MKPETFYSLLAEQNLPLSDQQKNQFERYFELLVSGMKKINLTAITDKGKFTLSTFMIRLPPSCKVWFQMKLSNFLISGLGQDFLVYPWKSSILS